MVLSGCSPTLVAALCALLTALAIMHYARVRREILDAQIDDSSSQLDMVIRAIQFDVSSAQANAHSGFISSASATTVRVERLDELTIKCKQSLVAGESPVHLKGHLLDGWELVNRSIWRLAMEKEWPVLTDVLSLQTVPASESFPSFLAHVSHEKGAMISQRVNAGQERALKRASIVRQMYFADFLNDMRANHFEYPLKNHSATNTYHFYSTDFKVLESLAKVQHLTRWRALQLDDFNSSHSVSQSQQQQQQEEQEQQEQQETMKGERERDAERDTESLGEENGSGERSSVLNTVAPVFSMLHPCSALQARYSEYHTMRAQVQGLTDYYLFAPEQAWALNLFPSIHPSAYQSQLNFQDMRCETLDGMEQNRDENGQNKNNLGVTKIAEESQQREICSSRFLSGVGGIEGGKVVKATLSAGEVLYIPPYWTVHTEARQLSVTIDVLTPSDTQRAFLRAVYISSQLLVSPSVLASRKSKTELPKSKEKKEGKERGTAETVVPESEDTKEEIRMRNEEELVLAQVFLSHVLSRIQGISSLNKYARKLYRSRWSALFPEESLFVQRSQFNCLRSRPGRHAEILRSINKEEVERAAERVAELANSDSDSDANLPPHPRPHFRGARSIWLAGFVENVARWAMKDADGAVFFIRECLALDGKIEVVEEVEGPSVLKVYPEEHFST